jgi:hypothetical protein
MTLEENMTRGKIPELYQEKRMFGKYRKAKERKEKKKMYCD